MSRWNRRLYKNREDIAIVKYILDNRGHHSLGGKSFWIEMESEMDINRSWQSMKERFRSVIVKELDNRLKYRITPAEAALLRSLITVKYRSERNHLDRRYREKMKENESLLLPNREEGWKNKNSLNDDSNSSNSHMNKWLDNIPTWVEMFPHETQMEIPPTAEPETPILIPCNAILNNEQNTSSTVQTVEVIEISSDEEDKSMTFSLKSIYLRPRKTVDIVESVIIKTEKTEVTEENIEYITARTEQNVENIESIIVKTEQNVENEVVPPGSSHDNTMGFVCESHQNLPKCFYCFLKAYRDNENSRPIL